MIRKKTLQELDRYSIVEYKKLPKIPVIVILDNIRSAHNVGSIFRTCDAFRIEKLYLCGITPVPPHHEIHKTALGATESVDWQYLQKTEDALNLYIKTHQLIAIEQAHNSIELEKFRYIKPMVLIFGNEVYGIDEEIIAKVDICVEIPQFGTKHSLNVSVSAGIVLYHVNKIFDLL